MARPAPILVCGLCPLPFENTLSSYGPGIRTWQFAAGLAAAGHEVRLLAMAIPGVYGSGEATAQESRDGVEIERVSDVELMDPAAVRRRIVEHRPRAVVGATIYGSFALAQTAPEIPFWADQFGHVMAEAQAKAALEGEDWPLAYFWRMVREVGRRADRISTVSERQRWAAIGELGALGRLTAETCGYDLVTALPCPLMPGGGAAKDGGVVRGRKVPEDAFIVLWSGSFNVWSDVETLYRGVATAMERHPGVHLVSTGGAIAGHDTATYARFQELVAASPFAERFHLEGWLRAERIPAYVADADLGVLTERAIYEGMLGSKNRVIQWMGAGLAVAYNRVGDLGDLLAEEELGITFPPGDAAGLAEAILWAAGHRDELTAMAVRAREAVERRFSLAESTRPLARWAADPRRAPDAGLREGITGPEDFEGLREQAAAQARRLPWLRRSPGVAVLWRRLAGRG